MSASRFRRFAQRHFAWLLWVALVVPIAQAAAMGHTVSHLRADTIDVVESAAKPLHAAHCVLCLAGEALSSSAITGVPPALPQSTALHAAPYTAFGRTWLAPLEQPYQSRAPPFVQH